MPEFELQEHHFLALLTFSASLDRRDEVLTAIKTQPQYVSVRDFNRQPVTVSLVPTDSPCKGAEHVKERAQVLLGMLPGCQQAYEDHLAHVVLMARADPAYVPRGSIPGMDNLTRIAKDVAIAAGRLAEDEEG